MYLKNYYQKFHNIFYRDEIKSAGQRFEWVFIINSLLTIYHTPTAKKISENQQKEILWYLKPQWYIIMLEFS